MNEILEGYFWLYNIEKKNFACTMYKYMYNEELYEDFNLFEQYTPIDLIYFITSHNHLMNDTLFFIFVICASPL